jgi:hypothetical protein
LTYPQKIYCSAAGWACLWLSAGFAVDTCQAIDFHQVFWLPRNWAEGWVMRKIKHLAQLGPICPQSYPQIAGTGRKVLFDHVLAALS